MIKPRNVVHLKFQGNYKTKLLKHDIVSKGHPVLVLDVLPNNQIRICTISHQMYQTDQIVQHNPPRPYNVVLDDCKSANLHQPSYTDVSTTGIIDVSNVHKILGSISSQDYNKVIKQFRITKQRTVLESGKIYNTGDPEYLDYTIDKNGVKHFLIEEEI